MNIDNKHAANTVFFKYLQRIYRNMEVHNCSAKTTANETTTMNLEDNANWQDIYLWQHILFSVFFFFFFLLPDYFFPSPMWPFAF